MKEERLAAPHAHLRADAPPHAARLTLAPGIARHAVDPERLGCLPQPDGYAHMRGDCGDALEVFLCVKDRRIAQARFDALGCEFTVACGNAAMQLAEGKSLDEAMQIGPEAVSSLLDGLPPDHFHCAELAVETLRTAIRDCRLRTDRSPGAPPPSRPPEGARSAHVRVHPLTHPG